MNTDKSFLNQRLSAFIGGEPFSPTLVPGGRIPWLALMMGDNLFKVGAELFIQRDRRVPLPGFPEDFRDWPAAMVWRPDHSYGAMALLDDHLDAFLDFGQDGMNVAGGLRCALGARRHGPVANPPGYTEADVSPAVPQP